MFWLGLAFIKRGCFRVTPVRDMPSLVRPRNCIAQEPREREREREREIEKGRVRAGPAYIAAVPVETKVSLSPLGKKVAHLQE
jgi:hypothetical protein